MQRTLFIISHSIMIYRQQHITPLGISIFRFSNGTNVDRMTKRFLFSTIEFSG